MNKNELLAYKLFFSKCPLSSHEIKKLGIANPYATIHNLQKRYDITIEYVIDHKSGLQHYYIPPTKENVYNIRISLDHRFDGVRDRSINNKGSLICRIINFIKKLWKK